MGKKKKKSSKPKNPPPPKTKQVWRVKTPPPPPWTELPRDVTANILQRLDFTEIHKRAQHVCTTWRSVCRDPSMWRSIEIKNGGYIDNKYHLKSMCRNAVNWSQGELVELSFEHFGDDELLDFICQRSTHLKRLSLACCYDVASKALSEAVKKTPQLEELHLNMMGLIVPEVIGTIGVSCPMLKSLTFTQPATMIPYIDDPDDDDGLAMEEPPYRNQYALAVANTMPNLHHLRLFGDYMNNAGLQAILDKCPHLESLDIRRCHGLDLGGDLGKRLFQQIKSVRPPSDPTADYAWEACASHNDDDFGSEMSDYYEDYEDYDDYTNPFNDDYFSDGDMFNFDPDAWIFDHGFF